MAAPVATWAVVGRTAFRVSTVAAPRPICTTVKRQRERAPVARSAGRARRGRLAQQVQDQRPRRASAPSRCAKWMATRALGRAAGRGGRRRAGSRGWRGRRPVWRMTAPSTSCENTTAGRERRPRRAGRRESARGRGRAATRARSRRRGRSSRQKKVWARQAWVTETGVGSRKRTVKPPRTPWATTAASAAQASRRTPRRGSRSARSRRPGRG